jgi:hypothetical protein
MTSLGVVFVWCVLAASAFAQGGSPPAQSTPESGVPVVYRGQEIVRIYRGLGTIGPAERARLTSARLNRFVHDPDFDPTHVIVVDRETHSEFVYEDGLLGIITDEDAKAVGRSRTELAREVRDRLVRVVQATREEFSPRSIAVGLVWAALATATLAILLWLVARLGRRVHARVTTWFRPLTEPNSATRRLT